MPVNTGKYANNETLLYNCLIEILGFNTAVACGLLANAEYESKFNTGAIGDSGTSVGLFQWHKGRKDNLVNYCRSQGLDYTSVRGQVYFLKHELEDNSKYYKYEELKSLPNTAQGAYDAAYDFCANFERPAAGATAAASRGKTARDSYWPYYSGQSGTTENYTGYGEGGSLSDGPLYEYDGEAIDFDSLTSNDIYQTTVASNLSAVQSAGYDYGYLIDVTHGGVFKFYVPEFTEQAGANWGTIKIPGRSVDIQQYESTTSRSIAINLDLYAGVGLYTSGDVVGKLHSDLNFVKSLEYPDYTTAIAQPPSTVHLILGSSVNLLGVVSSVSVEHLKPLDSQNRSMYVKLSFTVTQIAINPPDYTDIRAGQYAIAGTNDISSLQVGGSVESNALTYTD